MTSRTLLILLATLVVAASPAMADGDISIKHRQVVIEGGDGQATVTLDGDRLRVVAVEDGDVSVHEFDFSHLGEIIDGAVTTAMAELDAAFDEEFSIHVEDGGMVHVSQGDQACAFNLQILAGELRRSLANLDIQIGRELRHAHGVDAADEQNEMAELQAELDRLKAELESLREDLDRER